MANFTVTFDANPALNISSVSILESISVTQITPSIVLSGVIDVNNYILPEVAPSYLLLEQGGYLLQENGDRILLEVGL